MAFSFANAAGMTRGEIEKYMSSLDLNSVNGKPIRRLKIQQIVETGGTCTPSYPQSSEPQGGWPEGPHGKYIIQNLPEDGNENTADQFLLVSYAKDKHTPDYMLVKFYHHLEGINVFEMRVHFKKASGPPEHADISFLPTVNFGKSEYLGNVKPNLKVLDNDRMTGGNKIFCIKK